MPRFLCVPVALKNINPHTKFLDAPIKETLKSTSYKNLNLVKFA